MEAVDPLRMREVLGHLPTGVTIVAASTPDGEVGMTVGSLTSVSLEPPMIAFFPDRRSDTWPQIAAQGAFCVSVLARDQAELSSRFAKKGSPRFEQVAWEPAPSGHPAIEGAVAWIDCHVDKVVDAGDHFGVFAAVDGLDVHPERRHSPLVFFRGNFVGIEVERG